MKVLAVVQNKGGVGKTTVSRLLAEYFAAQKLRVLALDLDSQCNFSRRFLDMDYDPSEEDGILAPLHPDYDHEEEWSGRSSTADIYYSGEVVPYPTKLESLDILPGEGKKLRDVELVSRADVKAKVHDRLNDFLALEDVRNEYDLVLIDTSPSKGPLTVSAMRAASHILIPTAMEPQSIEGLYGMLQLWRRENRRRPIDQSLKILGILPNTFRKGVALHEGLLRSLQEDEGIKALLTPMLLHQRIAFAESDHPDAAPKSVFSLKVKDPARIEAERFCKYIEERLFEED
ncbi:MAG: hypothetical protein DRQ61_03645 [Gammaproteobacteria bacterium]|nr:MAG: hypothetical protein DRQ56_00450 [Gammaproteobacteria bacterium]RLA23503.1 MAG: hypothetical protein DRQ61_03645 [Gammaproteobacteria bacterium]